MSENKPKSKGRSGLFSYSVKPTKYAPHICTGVTIVALIGIVVGLVTGNALWPVILLFPTALYEAYRTGGKSTKAASLLLVAVLILELVLLAFGVSFNLVEFLGTTQQRIGGYWVPLGDITIVGPTVMAVLSVVLFTRTRGKFTKWLAVTIFITCFAIVYTIDPETFNEILRYAVQEGLRRI
jgi:hypothetical protein